MRAAVLASLLLATPALGETAQAFDAASAFGSRDDISGMSLSPDGEQVAYLSPSGGRGTVLMVASAKGGSPPKVVATSDGNPARLSSCDWADNNRLICRIFLVDNVYAKQLAFVRLIAVDSDGQNLKSLTNRGPRGFGDETRLSQFSGGVIDWMQSANGSVLMKRDHTPEATTGTHVAQTGDGLAVDLVDTRTLKSKIIEVPKRRVSSYISDGKGNVRLMEVEDQRGDGILTGRVNYYYRTLDSREWRLFSKTTESEGLVPISIDAEQNTAYSVQKLGGRLALYRTTLDGTLTTELAYADPRYDVDDVIRIGRQAHIIGVETVSDRRETTYFDPKYKALAASLSKAIPKLPLIRFLSSSRDENKLLLLASSDVDPGRYYTFDRSTRTLNEVALARPKLEKIPLAAQRSVIFKATDGTVIPAYLTLPPGSSGKALPAIVMPHGGPASRDEWGFDWLAQFYANRGYAVFQPEFRGSAGYGDSWLVKNGFQSWRTAIGDVNDAGRWLVAQGIADPSKLAIVGWSYGGYAALQANVLDPDLFKAVIAIAPVTDFDLLRTESQGFTSADLVDKFIGRGPHIAEGSPARHAASFKAPVLMFHGDRDLNVSINESRVMNDRLKSAGKTSELIVYPGLDHQLPDSQARADMLRRSDVFLGKALGH